MNFSTNISVLYAKYGAHIPSPNNCTKKMKIIVLQCFVYFTLLLSSALRFVSRVLQYVAALLNFVFDYHSDFSTLLITNWGKHITC